MSDDGFGIPEEEIPLLLVMAAGCIAGAIEATATWPMEYIKTQLQLQQRPLPVLAPRLTSWDNEPTTDGISMSLSAIMLEEELSAPPYTDMTSGIVYTVRVHGFWALYRGLTPTLLGSIPKAGIRFGLFHLLSELLRDDEGNISLGCNFLAGFTAGVLEALIIVAPVETIKTKCIELNMSFLVGLREILLMEGIRGIYDGVLATVLKQGSNHGLRFLWYHEYKRIVTHDGASSLTAGQAFIGGMTAGVFSTLGNQPFDVLKTRMQGILAHEQYASTWDCVCKTFKREGIPGFYTGMLPRLCRVIPGQGIIFMSFEIILNILVAIFGT